MSIAAVKWAFRQGGLTPVEKLVLVCIAEAERDGTCWPGRERIADACGVSPFSVSKAIAKFQKIGLLSVEKDGRKNYYRPNLDIETGGERPPVEQKTGGERPHENGSQVARDHHIGGVTPPDNREPEDNRKDDDEGARAISKKFVELFETHWPDRAPLLTPRMTLETEARQFLDAGGTVKLAIEHLEAQMPRVAAKGRSPPRSLKFFRDSLGDELAKQREPIAFQSKPGGASGTETREQRQKRIIEMARNGN